jgi:uncharacterized protein (TIGR03437 family)
VNAIFQDPPIHSARVPLFAFVILFSGATSGLPAQIVLPDQSATRGVSIPDQVTFASQGSSISGVQFDVQYDDSALSLAATLASPVSTLGKTLYAVDLSPNKKRFLIIGLNQSLIPDGTLINLVVNVSPSAPAATYALALSNVCGTGTSGNATPVAGIDGTLAVNAGTVALLQPSGVLSAGSYLPGAVAPGELITLFGSGIGPAVAQQPSGSVTSTVLGGTSVLFDGAAAPLLYAGSNQINAIVPYGVSGKTSTQLTITAQGKTIATVAQTVAATAPAIFTLNFSGSGAGAILNQDSSVNSPLNPAAKGTVISIFASGAGQTNPPGVDGQVTGTMLPTPLLPVTVQIGGLNAKVSYAGAAPGLVSGVTQVNALIPLGVNPGSAIPIVLNVGGVSSQVGVTIAIK